MKKPLTPNDRLYLFDVTFTGQMQIKATGHGIAADEVSSFLKDLLAIYNAHGIWVQVKAATESLEE